MRYAYKVWHSEQHKGPTKRRDGRVLDDHEISVQHLHVVDLVALQYQRESKVKASAKVLEPAARGLMVVLDTALGQDAADESITRFLVGLNAQDVDLCLIAEPLPQA